jgi:hypothetical protein
MADKLTLSLGGGLVLDPDILDGSAKFLKREEAIASLSTAIAAAHGNMSLEEVEAVMNTLRNSDADEMYNNAKEFLANKVEEQLNNQLVDTFNDETITAEEFKRVLQQRKELEQIKNNIVPEEASFMDIAAKDARVAGNPVKDSLARAARFRVLKNMVERTIGVEAESDIDILDMPEVALGLQSIFREDTIEFVREWRKKFGSAKNEDLPALFDEFSRRLEEDGITDNPDYKYLIANLVVDGRIDNARAEEWSRVLDKVFLAADAVVVAKAAFTGARMLRTASHAAAESSEELAEEVAEVAARRIAEGSGRIGEATSLKDAKFVSEDDAVKVATSIIPGKYYANNVSVKTVRALEVNARILKDLENTAIDGLTKEQIDEAVKRAKKDLIENNETNPIIQFSLKTGDNGEPNAVEFLVGHKNGEPFKTLTAAKEFAKKLGGEAVELEDGKYAVNVIKPLEIGAENVSMLSGAKNMLQMFFDNVDNFIDKDFLVMMEEAEVTQNHIISTFKQVFDNGILKAPRKARKKVSQLISQILLDENLANRSLSIDEFYNEFYKLHGRAPNDAEKMVIGTYRQLQDASYYLINKQIVRMYERDGAREMPAVIMDEPMRLKVMERKPSQVDENIAIYDEASGEIYVVGSHAGDRVLTREKLQELVGGRNIYEVHPANRPVANGAGEIGYIISKRKFSELEKISPVQIGYVNSGRIKYKDKHIVGFTRIRDRDMALGGGKLYLNPVAAYTAPTRKAAKEAIKKLKKAHMVARYAEGRVELKSLENSGLFSSNEIALLADNKFDDIIESLGAHGFRNLETYHAWLKKRGASLDDEINTWLDGHMPLPQDKDVFIVQADTNIQRQSLKSRMERSRADYRLTRIDGDVNIVDPILSMNKHLASVAGTVASSRVKQELLDQFVKTYGWMYKRKPGAGVSNIEVLESGLDKNVIRSIDDNRLISQAKTNELFLKRFLARKGELTTFIDRKVDDIVDSLLEKDLENVAEVTEFLNKHGIQTLKKSIFHAKLGFFNTATFLLQASQAAVLTALDPAAASKGLVKYFPLRLALMQSDPKNAEGVIRLLAKKGLVDDAEDMINRYRMFKQLGLNDYGNSISDLDSTDLYVSGNHIGSKILDVGLIPFKEGDRIVRMMAFNMAYENTKKAIKNGEPLRHLGKTLPKTTKMDSKEVRRELLAETNRLTLGMTASHVQLGFRGIAQLGTQFLGFPLRMVGALWNKNFTREERARLLLAYIGIGGLSGTFGPLYTTIEKQIVGNEPISPEDMSLLHVAVRDGLVDAIAFALNGGEWRGGFHKRAGVGTIFEQIYEKIVEGSLPALVLGPTGQVVEDGLDAVLDAWKMWSVANHPSMARIAGFVSDAGFGVIKSTISSASKAYKLWFAANYGKLVTTKGRIWKDATANEVFMKELVGLGDGDSEAMWDFVLDEKKERANAREAGRHMFEVFRKFMETKDPGKRKMMEEAYTAMALTAEQSPYYKDTIAEFRREAKRNAETMFEAVKERQQIRKLLEEGKE